ncbi:hypothetical protein [Cohnella rhizosphaerae]|uniref:Uncharacterized protein n=1 Tax=Cohnella rhizosphaerae TaxID=1457232 RepID=A0A9X4KW46_9BACL|nr:hypothetical protein [Cohnella rhizosphaerae]MDG0811583.1 hypothetical protein [Cohnella rhizosphaerae]
MQGEPAAGCDGEGIVVQPFSVLPGARGPVLYPSTRLLRAHPSAVFS